MLEQKGSCTYRIALLCYIESSLVEGNSSSIFKTYSSKCGVHTYLDWRMSWMLANGELKKCSSMFSNIWSGSKIHFGYCTGYIPWSSAESQRSIVSQMHVSKFIASVFVCLLILVNGCKANDCVLLVFRVGKCREVRQKNSVVGISPKPRWFKIFILALCIDYVNNKKGWVKSFYFKSGQ